MGFLGKLLGQQPDVTPEHVQTLSQFREQVLQSDQPVLVNIWSPTCAPCKRMAPELVATATRFQDRVRVVEIGTTAEPRLLGQLEVRSTPTTLVFDGGEEMGRVLGYRSRSWLGEMIEAEFPAN
ncbi:MAG: thioredoxin family protein [Proteobacteria bacterium]|nr:thioredoxin family protein [Pseudomonadota bacterium]